MALGGATLLARSTESWCSGREKLLAAMMVQLDAGAAQRAIALAVVIFLVQRVVSVVHAHLHALASIGVCSGQQSGQHRPTCCCSVCGYL